MEFWTLLTIGYSVMEHQMQFSIWFPTEDACWSVLLDNGSLYDQINATEGHLSLIHI